VRRTVAELRKEVGKGRPTLRPLDNDLDTRTGLRTPFLRSSDTFPSNKEAVHKTVAELRKEVGKGWPTSLHCVPLTTI
jgi:hypothetical protein